MEKHSGVIDLVRQSGRRLNNETRLGNIVDYMVDLFRYETGEERPFINIRSEMQAILKNPKHKGGVKAAFAEVKLQLPNLRRRAKSIMRNARNSP